MVHCIEIKTQPNTLLPRDLKPVQILIAPTCFLDSKRCFISQLTQSKCFILIFMPHQAQNQPLFQPYIGTNKPKLNGEVRKRKNPPERVSLSESSKSVEVVEVKSSGRSLPSLWLHKNKHFVFDVRSLQTCNILGQEGSIEGLAYLRLS